MMRGIERDAVLGRLRVDWKLAKTIRLQNVVILMDLWASTKPNENGERTPFQNEIHPLFGPPRLLLHLNDSSRVT